MSQILVIIWHKILATIFLLLVSFYKNCRYFLRSCWIAVLNALLCIWNTHWPTLPCYITQPSKRKLKKWCGSFRMIALLGFEFEVFIYLDSQLISSTTEGENQVNKISENVLTVYIKFKIFWDFILPQFSI